MKKAWELAIAPAKQLPMNAIGMYMTGNSLQIFSIFMVFTLFKTPIMALLNIQNTFARLESEGTRDKMWQVKVVFLACNLMALGLGVWKVDKMGLLPYVLLFSLVVGLEEWGCLLMLRTGLRDRIGWLGRRRGNRWRGRTRCGQHSETNERIEYIGRDLDMRIHERMFSESQ